MIDDSIFENLPDDPELAFLVLESEFREDCKKAVGFSRENDRIDIYYQQYISKVIGAISALNLENEFSPGSIPSIEDVNFSTYADFAKDVDHYTTKLRIKHGRRSKELSVALDADTKSKLRQLLNKVKETIDVLDVSHRKKEALHARAAALEAEINRGRTRFEIVGAMWVETCGKIGEGVDKLEPLRKWLDPIGNLIGQAKHEEATAPPRLPSTPKPKEIEDKRQHPEIDDDIPF